VRDAQREMAELYAAHFVDNLNGWGSSGYLQYQVCHSCRRAIVWKIHTDEGWKRRGLATAMLERARLDAPRYVWWTSGQLTDARPFWQKISKRTGFGYMPGKQCEHLDAAGRYRHFDAWPWRR
jgi:hypothetical protein